MLLVAIAIGVMSRASFGVAAAVLVAVALFYRVRWWMPFALALGLLVIAPLLVAAGDGEGANTLASLVVVLAGVGVTLLVVAERSKFRSGGS